MLGPLKVGGEVENSNFGGRLDLESQVEGILFSDANPLVKVQRIIRLGVDEEEAETLVSRHQIGQTTPIYYEHLEL